MIKDRFIQIWFVTLWCFLQCGLPNFVSANTNLDLHIAVASNFLPPMKKLIELFGSKIPGSIKLSVGSSGSLHSQIVNGAPFELFFSADQEKPSSLVLANLASKKYQHTYAIGKLVLWSPKNNVDPRQMLLSGSFSKVALANPDVAPYGKAAAAVLQALQLHKRYRSRQVQGQNIAQAYLYTYSGNAQLGFISASQNQKSTGSTWEIPNLLYQPIKQDVVLIRKSENQKGALQFLEFVKSDAAKEVIMQYGYEIANTH